MTNSSPTLCWAAHVPFWDITLAITSDISTSYFTTDWTHTFYLHFWLGRPDFSIIAYCGMAQYKRVADVQDMRRQGKLYS